MFITSAPSRFPASSKEDCVRVELLEEEVDLRHPRQGIGLLHRAAVEVDIALGQVKDRGDLQRGKLLDPQKMAGAEGHGRVPSVSPSIAKPGGRGKRPLIGLALPRRKA
jgi:hypothetical protein